MSAEVVLTPKGERWHRTRHPWTYRDDIKEAGEPPPDSVVRVRAPDRRLLGQAFYNPASKIVLRWLTDDPEEAIGRDFWARRLQAAIGLRERVVKDSNACRLVHSEADGFPGLVVDRYDRVVVLQALSLGIERQIPVITGLLQEMIRPEAIVARNDSPVRKLEGLPVEKKLIAGELPERIEVTEGDLRYLVNVLEGHKTGAYLDQRENRLMARAYADGGRVLDAFAYQGGFTLQMAGRADEVLAIEDSAAAVEGLKENLTLNRLDGVRVERANAFDRLKQLEQAGERFDRIVLDPPAFAKSRPELAGALRGYREINLRALRMLKSGGILITCSCSHQITEEIFGSILQEAAAAARRTVRRLEARAQSLDHPILLTHPESHYLKCLVLETAG